MDSVLLFVFWYDDSSAPVIFLFFFSMLTALAEIYTLSLHDALPIFRTDAGRRFVEACRIARLATSVGGPEDRKSTRLNSSHTVISYAVFCLKKKKLRGEGDVSAEVA